MPKLKKRTWGGFFPEYELRRRETGFNCNIGWEENLMHKLYSSMNPCSSFDPMYSCNNNSYHGGIFNLEFSPDGKELVAACEKNAIMIFDTLTRKLICNVPNAHENCVNGIKFLDNRVFATCSDDKTVALWDVRNSKRKIKSLLGHDNWVKNIEYSSEDGLLVTSGFDGRILGWNINSYTERNKSTELFRMQGLMRIKLTPDSKKLIICTTGGYLLIIHDLSLRDLHKDLLGFKPYVYRLMQLSSTPVVQPFDFTKLFRQKRNRIEFITDFPPGNFAEIIHSLQIHPQAWCVVSRNTARDGSEWTCVHDIQDLEKNGNEVEHESADAKYVDGDVSNTPRSSLSVERRAHDIQLALSNHRLEFMLRQRSSEEAQEVNNDINDYDDDEGRVDVSADDVPSSRSSHARDATFDLRVRFRASIDVMNTFRRMELRRMEEERSQETDNFDSVMISESLPMDDTDRDDNEVASISNLNFQLRQRRNRGSSGISERRANYRNVFYIRPELHQNRSVVVLNPDDYPHEVFKPHEIVKNAPRLINYSEELNKGKGFIKELCFSADGRLICSPYDCGVRLMMFDEKCSELSHCIQKTPQSLCVLSTITSHKNTVLSTRFSPVDCLLVSGCLNGKIVWHQPIL